jgi:predicted dehydrogenase
LITEGDMSNERVNNKTRPVRVGIIGIGRVQNFADGATGLVGMRLVALCDTWEERLKQAGKQYGVATYTDYDRFLKHEMDAAILANYFNEHAPFAIQALRSGKHVMSETAANSSLAEGVTVCREVEREDLYAGGELSVYPLQHGNAPFVPGGRGTCAGPPER